MTRTAAPKENDVSVAGAYAPEGARQDGDASFAAFLMSDPLPSRSAENFQKLLSGARRLTVHLVEAKEALRTIAEDRGAFSRDPLTHASNVIDEAKATARAILAKLEGK